MVVVVLMVINDTPIPARKAQTVTKMTHCRLGIIRDSFVFAIICDRNNSQIQNILEYFSVVFGKTGCHETQILNRANKYINFYIGIFFRREKFTKYEVLTLNKQNLVHLNIVFSTPKVLKPKVILCG